MSVVTIEEYSLDRMRMCLHIHYIMDMYHYPVVKLNKLMGVELSLDLTVMGDKMLTKDELKAISDEIASYIRDELFPPKEAGQLPPEVAQLWATNLIKFGLLWYLSLKCFPERFNIEQLRALQFAVGSLIESKISEIREELLRRN